MNKLMNLYSSMRTAVSGMNAHGVQLSSVAGNIANTGTTGYKRTSVEFESMLVNRDNSNAISGGVNARVRQSSDEQGLIKAAGSATDLAISGEGYFVVRGQGEGLLLTRSGSFDFDKDGALVNSPGYRLQGYDLSTGGAPLKETPTIGDLTTVRIDRDGLVANPSTLAKVSANLPALAIVREPGQLPSDNAVLSLATARSSLVAYDSIGKPITLDVYFTKIDDNRWEISIYDRDGATNGGFPYSEDALLNSVINFDALTGRINSEVEFSLLKPDGTQMTLDISGITQLAANFQIHRFDVDGNAPSSFLGAEIDAEGIVYAKYNDGSRRALYQIPSGMVPSPTGLDAADGSAFRESSRSGAIMLSRFGSSENGRVVSYALETSTVDIGDELTSMIEAQRSYAANSKVFKTSTDMLDILMSLRP